MAEDKRKRKTVIHLNKYYDDVVACLQDADAILILGPDEAKGEFTKRIERQKAQGAPAHGETADKMTDPQIAAYVREHFAKAQHS